MPRYICIHGHFYQPPRDNPWLEAIELQDSSYPYHDWNARINAECYQPNAFSRILGGDRTIVDIINNYSKISFNFGPTLLSWMEKKAPDTYAALLEADKKSIELFGGHGAAIAQCYNHMIMPLANSRDKRTQAIWGIRDFAHRFGRSPEGIWLPETAVDLETLEILADNGIRFTILSPYQAAKVRKIGDKDWTDVSGGRIDPKMSYVCRLSSGREISLFFYDGPISQELAFGNTLDRGEVFAGRLTSAFTNGDGGADQLVHIATDGETYGHHHRFGEMALSYCLYDIETHGAAKLTIYGDYLEKHPPAYEAEIFENSSWSCIHGVERWKSNCGCNSGMHGGWHQEWRGPLRGALDWLRDSAVQVYEKTATPLLKDPWAARDDYIDVVLKRDADRTDRFFARHAARELSADERITAVKLLEMQRFAMHMYTSCGWFFDEISGIETVQVIEYAARVVQLARETAGVDFEEAFVNLLGRAPGNIPEYKDGAAVYERFVRPAVANLLRVGVHYAVSSLFETYKDDDKIYCYATHNVTRDLSEIGKQKLLTGRVVIASAITGEQQDIIYGVLHFGDHNLAGAAREFMGDGPFVEMQQELKASFQKSELQDTLRILDKHFGQGTYSLWHLFRDEQRKVLDLIFDKALGEIHAAFRQIFEHHAPLIQVAEKLQTPLPKTFSSIAEAVLNMDIKRLLESDDTDVAKLKMLIDEISRFSLSLDMVTLNYVASAKVTAYMKRFAENPEDGAFLDMLVQFFKAVERLSLDLRLWEAQNSYFAVGKRLFAGMKQAADAGDEETKQWVENFTQLGVHLKVRIG